MRDVVKDTILDALYCEGDKRRGGKVFRHRYNQIIWTRQLVSDIANLNPEEFKRKYKFWEDGLADANRKLRRSARDRDRYDELMRTFNPKWRAWNEEDPMAIQPNPPGVIYYRGFYLEKECVERLKEVIERRKAKGWATEWIEENSEINLA